MFALALATLDIERVAVTHDATSVADQAGPMIDRFSLKDSKWPGGTLGAL